nr:MAG TPA: hypothetical protein [Caudoviricetes sp.]
MITRIIIGFFVIVGAVDTLTSIITRAFPKSRATKFLFKYCSVKFDPRTYERID